MKVAPLFCVKKNYFYAKSDYFYAKCVFIQKGCYVIPIKESTKEMIFKGGKNVEEKNDK